MPQTAGTSATATAPSPKIWMRRSETTAPGAPSRLRTGAPVAWLRLGSFTDQVMSATDSVAATHEQDEADPFGAAPPGEGEERIRQALEGRFVTTQRMHGRDRNSEHRPKPRMDRVKAPLTLRWSRRAGASSRRGRAACAEPSGARPTRQRQARRDLLQRGRIEVARDQDEEAAFVRQGSAIRTGLGEQRADALDQQRAYRSPRSRRDLSAAAAARRGGRPGYRARRRDRHRRRARPDAEERRQPRVRPRFAEFHREAGAAAPKAAAARRRGRRRGLCPPRPRSPPAD